MSLAERMPLRISHFARAPRSRHRAVDEVDRQKALRVGADLRIKALGVQLADAEARHAQVVARIDQRYAEIVRGLERQVADLERRLGIACQATAAADQTQEIDTEAVARMCAQPVPLFEAPFATTDPGRVPPSWARTT